MNVIEAIGLQEVTYGKGTNKKKGAISEYGAYCHLEAKEKKDKKRPRKVKFPGKQ